MNYIFNENSFKTMNRDELLKKIDLIITSPPDKYLKKFNKEYVSWSINLFKNFDKILKENSCVLYNLSYSKNPINLFALISDVVENTTFTVADIIIWKKDNIISNNKSKNKLNKITEYIFVFCRKDEIKTFNTNKSVISYSDKLNRPTSYSDIDDFIITENYDEFNINDKNNFSVDLILELLNRYGIKDGIVYDPFIRYGITAKGAIEFGMNYIGSELDINKIELANSILHEVKFIDDEYRVEIVQSTEDDDFWNH